jgi:hypothetical protein
MNTRRLSYGLLATLAAAMMAACGGDDAQPAAPPQASAAPADTGAPTAAAEPPPAPAPTAAPEPPPPPPKPASSKWAGNYVQDFSGDVKDAADAAAKKAAGKVDKDGKKYNAAMDKAAKSVADNTLVAAADTLTWNVKGKAAHTYKIAIKGDDPGSFTMTISADGKKAMKTPLDVTVTFTDDNTFNFKDPTAKDPSKAATLVFKRQ